VAKREIIELFVPGSHGSTFGGNPLAAAVGMEALKVIEQENLVQRCADLGAHLMQSLKDINHPAIKDIRGKGLWVGLELDPMRVKGRDLALKLLEKGVLTKETHEKTLRLAPPLVITKEELDWGIEQLKDALNSF
jgi:ornithine--oxo-acid transaminase